MSTSKRTLEDLELSKAKRVCRPAPLKLKCSNMPTHLANGDNLSPFLAQNGQPSPIPESSSARPLPQLANGNNLSPRLVQQIGEPSPIPHTLLNQSLNINEPSETTPTRRPFLFSGIEENAQPTVEFNPRLSTPNNEASNTVNVNWPLPYTRSSQRGWLRYSQPDLVRHSSMTDSDSQSSGSPRSFHFNPRAFPAPRIRTRVQYFGRPEGKPRKKPRFIISFRRGCPQCYHRTPGHINHIIFS
ncbi:hypothetical protein N7471_005867 [Penicillium samsonianum]|uniref:uncharacterized protein n=1 Tax=Penicillium samsonianum TaxID=1882272 RepID=UPI0025499EED|nr:uncharacterized protein N7471_005867 [Penicillium samsonianum]KAJ6139381.1 hypothetical protein N7471_005867 [Penicillium samsonianum]